jgi:galactose mutarotase-like enzyme
MEATFLPSHGMLGVSLRVGSDEYLDLRGGLGAYDAGHTVGLPLLHPWANRLAARTYAVDDLDVDLSGLDLPTDAGGLPMHGTMLGPSEWAPVAIGTSVSAASFTARYRYGLGSPGRYAAFPFPHDLAVEVVVDGSLSVRTTVRATGERPVPVSFGWHPWFRIPRARRDHLRLMLPARQHVTLDERCIPTGESDVEHAEEIPLAGRTFDDHYVLGGSRLAFGTSSRRVVMEVDDGYPFAQVYAPEGEPVVCLEPMVARVDALGAGVAPLLMPGDLFTARFVVSIERDGAAARA